MGGKGREGGRGRKGRKGGRKGREKGREGKEGKGEVASWLLGDRSPCPVTPVVKYEIECTCATCVCGN